MTNGSTLAKYKYHLPFSKPIYPTVYHSALYTINTMFMIETWRPGQRSGSAGPNLYFNLL